MRRWSMLLGIVLAAVVQTGNASAAEGVDTVVLTNGVRLIGRVKIDPLSKRVLVHLAHETRVLLPSEVTSITYGEPEEDSNRVCVPGAQVECACMGGATGVQACTPDGSRYGTCKCRRAVVIEESSQEDEDHTPLVKARHQETIAPKMVRANPGVWVAGMTLVLIGSASIAVGGAFLGGMSSASGSDRSTFLTVALGSSITGLVFDLIGLPLVIVGGRQVPADNNEAAITPLFKPRVAIGAGTLRLDWKF